MTTPAKKSILFLCPYDHIYPPMNGGMIRCFHILHQLAKYFEVTAIIHQDPREFEGALDRFPELKGVDIYSTKNETKPLDLFSLFPQRIKNALRYRWYKRTATGTTDSNLLLYYPVLRKCMKAKKFDVVILENLDTINAVSVIRRYNKNALVLYDTHNVGSLLAEEDVKKGIMVKENMLAVKNAEYNLYKNVNAIFTCSKIELDTFSKMNKHLLQGTVIPNGTHIEERRYESGVLSDDPRYILFCGSLGYDPNIEGLLWFCQSIWPAVRLRFPLLKLFVVGSGRLPVKHQWMEADKSLLFTGTVADVKPFYDKASIAIVPLKSGSGTRLKILEAMGLGLPVLATSKGAEGIQYSHTKDIMVADDSSSFAEALIQLLQQKEKRLSIQQAAFKLVKSRYDWNVIGFVMADYIHQKINGRQREKALPSSGSRRISVRQND
jgi:glycosyltransferase involved in cell wall biosynthesis